MTRCRALIVFILSCITATMYAMVYDNRYLPLFQLPYVTLTGCNSYFTTSAFVISAGKFFERADKEIGLPEVWGTYDQAKLAYAIETTGKPNLLLPKWRNDDLPWVMQGKMQGQGMTFSFQKAIANHFILGFNTFFMRLNARTIFAFDSTLGNTINEAGNRQELDAIRREMNNQLGLNAGYISQAGFGDFDLYVGAYNEWEYVSKFKQIYTDFRFGLLAPMGVRQDMNLLGSIPFGGDGHWGIYVSNWSEFEVKEDWKVGFLLRVSRRFQKTQISRMPVKGEPITFGATCGLLKVDPAPTVIFAPYIAFENLREGFGARVVYTLRHHSRDYWCDARKEPNAIPVDLTEAQNQTAWNSDYFTLEAFYDFGKTKIERSLEPVLYLAWDVPSAMLATKRVAKTQRISLGLQLTF